MRPNTGIGVEELSSVLSVTVANVIHPTAKISCRLVSLETKASFQPQSLVRTMIINVSHLLLDDAQSDVQSNLPASNLTAPDPLLTGTGPVPLAAINDHC
jgi:hypothetical protein